MTSYVHARTSHCVTAHVQIVIKRKRFCFLGRRKKTIFLSYFKRRKEPTWIRILIFEYPVASFHRLLGRTSKLKSNPETKLILWKTFSMGFDSSAKKNMKPRTICLPSQQSMPIIGLGTWQAEPEAVEKAVTWALETGYRSIDTAYNYGNEKAIGKAIQSWMEKGRKREELFVTTKLPNFGNRPEDVRKYLNESLRNLKLDYVDLYLIHHPFGFCKPPSQSEPPSLDMETDHLALWKEMEAAVCSGLVRNIGLSNFNRKQVERVASKAEVPPANLQIELHVYLQQRDLIEACEKLGISVTAYAPLGSPTAKTHFKAKYDFQTKGVPDPMREPKVLAIAEKWKRTPAQVLLSFLMQMGIAVVPKSASRERIKQNFEALDFDLDEKDMETLKCLDLGENGRLFDFLFFKGVEKHPEYPFHLKAS